MAKKPVSKQPEKPTPTPPKARKPAATPVKGNPATKPPGNTGKPASGAPVKPQLPAKPNIKPLPAIKPAPPAKSDLGKPLIKSGKISAEMYAVGKGSRLCQSLMMALKHEGKPGYVSDDKYLKRFARYGWDDEEDEQAKQVLKSFRRAADVDSEAALVADLEVIGGQALDTLNAEVQPQLDQLRQQYLRNELSLREFIRLSLDVSAERRALERRLHNLGDGENSSDEYAELLETTLGYNVAFAEGFDEAERVAQVSALTASSLYLLNYIDSVAPGRSMSGFQQFFSEHGLVNIQLGAEKVVALGDDEGYSGLTPLSASSYDIYLGSQMTIGAITHEFIHQLDRAVERGAASPLIPTGTSLSDYLNANFTQETDVPLNPQYVYEVGPYSDPNQPGYSIAQVVTGYVGQVADVGSGEELLADIGMTAVLSGSGQSVLVRVSNDSFQEFPVEWAATQNAANVQLYIDQLMGGLFGS